VPLLAVLLCFDLKVLEKFILLFLGHRNGLECQRCILHYSAQAKRIICVLWAMRKIASTANLLDNE